MKKTKFISSLLSAILILSAVAVPVAAADVNQNSSGGTATVSYTNDSVWTATIPAYVAPVEAGQQDVSAYEVAVKDVVIGDNQQLAATIEYSGYVTEANGVKIPYQLYDSDGEEIQSGDTIISKNAGEPGTEAAITFGAALTDSPKYAGVYTDTATFTFTAKDKVYSLDEINADEHLFAIGKTNPEYVVAEFNDDFSEVTIFANGEDSDGLMKDFTPPSYSPMYENKATLESAEICSGVSSIGNCAFFYCGSLASVSLPDSITSIGSKTFYECKSLNNVTIPNYVTNIGEYAFYNCDSITSISVPAKVVSIGDNAFYHCDSLEMVTMENGVPYIGNYMFSACGLQRITIPSSVQSIGNYAFSGCSSLEEISIPDSVKNIGEYAFYHCDALGSITLPASITSIESCTFYYCRSLKNIIIPNGVTTIGSSAFSTCISLETIVIPGSVTNIGNNAFNVCHALKSIIGVSGSYAETWATDNGYTFIAQ